MSDLSPDALPQNENPTGWPRPFDGLTRQTAVVFGYRMSYVTGGSGPPIVLFHGLGSTSFSWRYTLPILAQQYTVYAPDMLGAGESDKPEVDYSIASLASYANAFMHAIGLTRAHVIGHSLGGGVALKLSQLYPDRIERLILVSSGGMGREVHWLLRAATLPGADPVLRMMVDPRSPLPEASRKAEIRRMEQLQVEFDKNIPTVLDRMRSPEARKAFLRTVRGISGLNGQKVSALPHLHHLLDKPVLLIWGANDRTIPATHGQNAVKFISNAHLEIIEHCYHRPQIETPQVFNQMVLDFLSAEAWPPEGVHDAVVPAKFSGLASRYPRMAGAWRTIRPAIGPAAMAFVPAAGMTFILASGARKRRLAR